MPEWPDSDIFFTCQEYYIFVDVEFYFIYFNLV